jgi:hypothetical protein
MNKSRSKRRNGRLDARLQRAVDKLQARRRTEYGERFLTAFHDAVRGERMERFWVYDLVMHVRVAGAAGVDAIDLTVGVV